VQLKQQQTGLPNLHLLPQEEMVLQLPSEQSLQMVAVAVVEVIALMGHKVVQVAVAQMVERVVL
jgi:hypothetical protein